MVDDDEDERENGDAVQIVAEHVDLTKEEDDEKLNESSERWMDQYDIVQIVTQ